MGQNNINRFVTDVNEEKPSVLWKLLVNHYESNSPENQLKVFDNFLTLTFKDIAQFINNMNAHLSAMASVGIVIAPEGPNSHIRKHYVAEMIVKKIPERLNVTKELLFGKRPLTIEKVREALTSKARRAAETTITVKTEESALTASKPRQNANYSTPKEVCSDGKHNPKTLHSEKNCFQLRKNKHKAHRAAQEDDSDEETDRSEITASSMKAISRAYSLIKSSDTVFMDSGASHHMFTD